MNLKEYIVYFDDIFNDILFENLDITLGYNEERNVIVVFIDNILYGYIDYDFYFDQWELYNKNYDFVNYVGKDFYYQTALLFNFIEKCKQRIELEKNLNAIGEKYKKKDYKNDRVF